MKRSSIAMATAIGVSCFSFWSCNSQDPSAARENEKALAEATSKVAKLEEEIANLKADNEALTQKVANSETKTENGLTAAQLDTKLKAMAGTLAEQLATVNKKLDSVAAQTNLVIAQNDTRNKDAQAAAQAAALAAQQAAAAAAQRPPDPPREPARPQPPATPSKPKPKYDITLDNPVMGPGSR